MREKTNCDQSANWMKFFLTMQSSASLRVVAITAYAMKVDSGKEPISRFDDFKR
jgi:hypothetical protein